MNKPEILNDEVKRNEDYFRQDKSIMDMEDTGLADRLLTNDKLYRAMKGDWERSDWSGSGVTKVTTGRKDGKFFITREQHNIEAIKAGVKRYRELAEAGVPDPLAPIGQDGKLQWSWCVIPRVIAQRISDNYFGGIPWDVIKRDKPMKAQWYMVVQKEFPEYITYPGGKLPIPMSMPYPAKAGERKFHKGI